MKYLLYGLLVLLLAVTLALIAYRDPGQVIISYSGWTIETTVAFVAAALVVFGAALYVAARLVRTTWALPLRLRRWRQNRRLAQAGKALTYGWIALAEGNYQKAEQRLSQGAEQGDMPFLRHLAAARAAHELGAYARRDMHLDNAAAALPSGAVAAGLVRARYQLDGGQIEEAHATVARLQGLKPDHERVQALSLAVHARLGDCERVLEELPRARKLGIVTEVEADAYARDAYVHLLTAASHTADPEEFVRAGQRIPREWLADAAVTAALARGYLDRDDPGAAEKVLRDALNERWDSGLAELYGTVAGSDAGAQLAQAERWLADHGEDAALRLTVGRLCVRNQLWGKARANLEASIALRPRPEAYGELGALFERLREPDAARECYRSGLAACAAASS